MINVITGYEIASNVAKSEILKKEVEEFYLNKMNEIASNCLDGTRLKKKKNEIGIREKIEVSAKDIK